MSIQKNTCENDENENSKLHNSENNSPTKVNLLANPHTASTHVSSFRWLKRRSKFAMISGISLLVMVLLIVGIYVISFIDHSESIESDYDGECAAMHEISKYKNTS